MRGLKPSFCRYSTLCFVASFTDAWIETVLQNLSVKPPESHLLQMRGLKQTGLATDYGGYSRIFYRCVD